MSPLLERGAVVDASVGVKWLVPEEFTPLAERLVALSVPLHVPEHFVTEVGNALTTKLARGQITVAVAEAAVDTLSELGFTTHRAIDLMPAALGIARTYQRSMYDALYVALALRLGVPLVTADRRLYNAVSGPLPYAVLWIEDVPAA